MRIAHLVCVYPPYGGGMGAVAQQYAGMLAAEHEVTVFTPHYPGRPIPQTSGNIKIENLFSWGHMGNAAFLPQLASRLKKFDIVHLHYPFFGVQEWLTWALPSTVKLVITYHMQATAGGLKGLLFKAGLAFTNHRLARRADVLTASTQDYINTVALSAMGGVGKWQVVPFAVEDEFTPGLVPKYLTEKLSVPSHTPMILFVGSMDTAHAFKGVSILLLALKKIQDKSWQVVVVGDGNMCVEYQAQVEHLGLSSRVHFVGFVPQKDLVNYYRSANIFVLPSTSQAEAFGLVALQAMACGVPVVASRLPGVQELVQDNITGKLCEPGSVVSLSAILNSILSSPEQARALGQAGLTRVQEHYTYAQVQFKLLQLYKTLV